MKKILVFFLTLVCIFGMSGCAGKADAPTEPVGDSAQSADTVDLNGEKSWSEEDITAMFSQVKEADWEYRDCVLMPDHASERVGAVLFRDDQRGTSNVAFFDADGNFQQCGTEARLSAVPDLTYLGDGVVTYELEAEDGKSYTHTLTISIDGSNVNFKAEDDAPK